MRPSFLAHAFNGILAFFALILYIMNYKNFDMKDNIIILLLLSCSWGIHSVLHHFEERYYGFNPLKWL